MPGLIIFWDEKDNYNFSFVKNVNLKETYDTSNFFRSKIWKQTNSISEKIFVNKKLEYFNDPIHDIKSKLESGTTNSVDFNGVRYTKADQLRPIIEQEQNYLRKNNNPIELNKALKYPKK